MHFFFPALIKQQDLVIGINTSGKFPAFAKWLRQKITALLPPVYGLLLDALAPLRTEIAQLTNPTQKKIVTERLLEEAEQIKSLQELTKWQAGLDHKVNDLLQEKPDQRPGL